MPTDSKLLHVLVDPELRQRLDDYRYAHRYPTLAETIRAILRKVLDEDTHVKTGGSDA